VSRIHTNENITFCLYLVDLLCLGVKDSSYKFNVTETEFRNIIESIEERMEMEMIDYVLAHNIILSGVEFAEEYGFKPHKDFTSVTEFMLEEDSDDIELMEIECGREGKPLYVQGPYDSDATANKIMKQLEKTAGTGNYDFIREGEESEDDWDDDDDQFKELTLDEKGEKFIQYLERFTKLKEEEYRDYLELLQSIVDDFLDIEMYNRFYDELTDEFNSIPVEYDKIPNELLGINDSSVQIPEEIKQSFVSVIREDSLKQRDKKIKSFGKNSEYEAAIDYFDLVDHANKRSSKYEKKLKKAAEKHPDYAILQLKMAKLNFEHKENFESLPYYPFKMENFFKGREYIHSWEIFCYLDFYTHLVIAEQNFAKLDALKTVIQELDISKDEKTVFDALIAIMQTSLVAEYFKEDNNKVDN
ncbi:MAG: hypothetical protein LC658_03255, partial [Bacteroidales bacterium]|nr:hypothetical protein [Bacteroidales bacterium]